MNLFLFVSFLILCLAGVADTAYIFWRNKKSAQEPFICPLGHDCSVVTQSSWSNFLGIRNEILGMIFYLLMFVGSIFWFGFSSSVPLLSWLITAGLAVGVLFSIFLLGIQVFVLKNYCFYCLLSFLITLLLSIVGWFLIVPTLGGFGEIINSVVWISAWLPKIFLSLSFLLAIFLLYRFRKGKLSVSLGSVVKKISWAVVVFYVIFALFLTAVQYYLWFQDNLTKSFLETPAFISGQSASSGLGQWLFGGKLGYFLFYSWGRFWLGALLSLAAAFLWRLFLGVLKNHNERFFEEGDMEIGFLGALVCGWPNFLSFLVFTFILVVIFGFLRLILAGEKYTTLTWPFILSVLITLAGGYFWISSFGFGVLVV